MFVPHFNLTRVQNKPTKLHRLTNQNGNLSIGKHCSLHSFASKNVSWIVKEQEREYKMNRGKVDWRRSNKKKIYLFFHCKLMSLVSTGLIVFTIFRVCKLAPCMHSSQNIKWSWQCIWCLFALHFNSKILVLLVRITVLIFLLNYNATSPWNTWHIFRFFFFLYTTAMFMHTFTELGWVLYENCLYSNSHEIVQWSFIIYFWICFP